MRHVLSNRARALWTAMILLAALALPLSVSAVPASAVPASAVPASAVPASAASAATASVAAAGRSGKAARVPHYNHIAVIMFTSHDYGSILHNRFAPTFNRLAKQYGLASNYYTTSDPDTANVMALLAGNDYGISDGAPYWDSRVNKPSLLSQLDKAHKSWKEYAQGLPYPGYLGDCYPGNCIETDSLYNQIQFNAVPDLTSVADNPAEARKMVPAAELATDARTGHLPDFSFIDPNECAGMHGGPPWCEDSSNNYHQFDDNALVSGGDTYLGQVVHAIMSGPQWKKGNNAIVVSFTEGDTSQGCCDVKVGTGHVLTIVITSYGPRHLTDPVPFNHYSLLRTIEDAFGLPCLGHACDKVLVPMAKLFGAKSDAPAGPAADSRTVQATRAAVTSHVIRPAAVSPWAVVPSPNLGPNDNDLSAISGRSASDIWAVGGLLPTANATVVRTLAVHYNGTSWSHVTTPDVGSQANSFYGLAALPDGTAWATGIYTTSSGHTSHALTEHWTKRSGWRIVRAVNPGSQDDMLYSATAISDSDVWAVGGYSGPDGFFHPLIEHWDGHHWTVSRAKGLSGDDGILTSVASAPGEGVWATGQLTSHAPDQQVVLHLAGGSWVVMRGVVRTPGGAAASAYPESIGISPLGAWVDGNDRAGHAGFSTLVEGPGSGGHLMEQKTPNPTPQDNYLAGIAPVMGGHNAWAVGYSLPVSTGNAASLIEFGSAAGWKTVPSPDPGAVNKGNTFINAVLALGNDNVWAVGTFDGPNGERTLILHFTGGAI